MFPLFGQANSHALVEHSYGYVEMAQYSITERDIAAPPGTLSSM